MDLIIALLTYLRNYIQQTFYEICWIAHPIFDIMQFWQLKWKKVILSYFWTLKAIQWGMTLQLLPQ